MQKQGKVNFLRGNKNKGYFQRLGFINLKSYLFEEPLDKLEHQVLHRSELIIGLVWRKLSALFRREDNYPHMLLV